MLGGRWNAPLQPIENLPLNILPLILALIGASIGGQINRAIYTWAWDPRQISPWSKKPEKAAARKWTDCIPIFGWWPMRREAKLHGNGFWLRPMLIELCWAIGLPWFYSWSIGGGQLEVAPGANLLGVLQLRFLAQAVLLALMTIATFIDFDEKTIPDFVTIPGTLFALLFAWLAPTSLMPINFPPAPLLLTPNDTWPVWLDSPALPGLWTALGCWLGWCLALLPTTVYFRHGISRGLRILVGSVFNERRRLVTYAIGGMFVVGAVLITLARRQGGDNWHVLLSSLVGMAAAGGFVWSIRIVAGGVLGVEAMGFGDVTLMAMIGAFMGWQAATLTFFIAPFTGIAIVLAKLIFSGNREVAFGPFLCAGATIVLLCWTDIWARWGRILGGPDAIAFAIILCLMPLAMGVMLAAIRFGQRMLGLR